MSESQRVKELYLGLKKTQQEFSDEIGIKQATISGIIHNDRSPSFKVVAAILKTYPNLNPRWFILGEGEMWNNEDPTYQEPSNEVLKNKVESLERENQLLREMNELLKKNQK